MKKRETKTFIVKDCDIFETFDTLDRQVNLFLLKGKMFLISCQDTIRTEGNNRYSIRNIIFEYEVPY